MLQVMFDFYMGKAQLEFMLYFPMAVYVIILVLALIFSSFFFGIWVIYKYVFRSPHKGQNDIHNIPSIKQYGEKIDVINDHIDRLAGRPYEQVCIKSYDGKKLYARC